VTCSLHLFRGASAFRVQVSNRTASSFNFCHKHHRILNTEARCKQSDESQHQALHIEMLCTMPSWVTCSLHLFRDASVFRIQACNRTVSSFDFCYKHHRILNTEARCKQSDKSQHQALHIQMLCTMPSLVTCSLHLFRDAFVFRIQMSNRTVSSFAFCFVQEPILTIACRSHTLHRAVYPRMFAESR